MALAVAIPQFYVPQNLTYALSDSPNDVAQLLVMVDTEGTHYGIAATLSLGCGTLGYAGIPWNSCFYSVTATPTIVPTGSDPPLPPVYPYPISSGSVYGRENLNATLKMIRGDSFSFKFAVYLNGTPVDITGSTFTMSCRYRPNEAIVFTRTSSPADGIALTDPTNGVATVTLVPDNTNFLKNVPLRFSYDVEMTDGSGAVTTVLLGTLIIQPDVTYVDA